MSVSFSSVSSADRRGGPFVSYCADCGGALVEHPVAAHLSLGGLDYHASCQPACASCGRHRQPGDDDWDVEAQVVSESWGYRVRPLRQWCAACLETAPRDEPLGLD